MSNKRRWIITSIALVLVLGLFGFGVWAALPSTFSITNQITFTAQGTNVDITVTGTNRGKPINIPNNTAELRGNDSQSITIPDQVFAGSGASKAIVYTISFTNVESESSVKIISPSFQGTSNVSVSATYTIGGQTYDSDEGINIAYHDETYVVTLTYILLSESSNVTYFPNLAFTLEYTEDTRVEPSSNEIELVSWTKSTFEYEEGISVEDCGITIQIVETGVNVSMTSANSELVLPHGYNYVGSQTATLKYYYDQYGTEDYYAIHHTITKNAAKISSIVINGTERRNIGGVDNVYLPTNATSFTFKVDGDSNSNFYVFNSANTPVQVTANETQTWSLPDIGFGTTFGYVYVVSAPKSMDVSGYDDPYELSHETGCSIVSFSIGKQSHISNIQVWKTTGGNDTEVASNANDEGDRIHIHLQNNSSIVSKITFDVPSGYTYLATFENGTTSSNMANTSYTFHNGENHIMVFVYGNGGNIVESADIYFSLDSSYYTYSGNSAPFALNAQNIWMDGDKVLTTATDWITGLNSSYFENNECFTNTVPTVSSLTVDGVAADPTTTWPTFALGEHSLSVVLNFNGTYFEYRFVVEVVDSASFALTQDNYTLTMQGNDWSYGVYGTVMTLKNDYIPGSTDHSSSMSATCNFENVDSITITKVTNAYYDQCYMLQFLDSGSNILYTRYVFSDEKKSPAYTTAYAIIDVGILSSDTTYIFHSYSSKIALDAATYNSNENVWTAEAEAPFGAIVSVEALQYATVELTNTGSLMVMDDVIICSASGEQTIEFTVTSANGIVVRNYVLTLTVAAEEAHDFDLGTLTIGSVSKDLHYYNTLGTILANADENSELLNSIDIGSSSPSHVIAKTWINSSVASSVIANDKMTLTFTLSEEAAAEDLQWIFLTDAFTDMENLEGIMIEAEPSTSGTELELDVNTDYVHFTILNSNFVQYEVYIYIVSDPTDYVAQMTIGQDTYTIYQASNGDIFSSFVGFELFMVEEETEEDEETHEEVTSTMIMSTIGIDYESATLSHNNELDADYYTASITLGSNYSEFAISYVDSGMDMENLAEYTNGDVNVYNDSAYGAYFTIAGIDANGAMLQIYFGYMNATLLAAMLASGA